MSWFDNISKTASKGANSVMNWFGGNEKKAAPAAAKAPAPAAPAAAAPAAEKKGWADSGWAKATGLAPWAKMGETIFGTGGDKKESGQTGYGAKPRGGGSPVKNEVTTGTKKTGFERDHEKGGFKTPEYFKTTRASGVSGGNSKDAKEKNALNGKDEAQGLPTVWSPDLSKIPDTHKSGVMTKKDAADKVKDTGQAYSESGSFRSSKYGSYSGGTGLAADKEADNKFTVGHNGKGSMGIAGWEGQWGAEEKGGWRSTGVSKDGLTQHQVEAGWVASGGASGSYGLDTAKGAYAQGGVGGKAGVYAQGDWDTKSKSVKVGGVDYDAGIGVHGDAFAGVKAGASGQIGFGPEFMGAKGDIGAFVGAEAAGDVHGNLGPLGAKAGGSVMAGAGIGAEGNLSYEDGKLHFGGKAFAALGYGGSLSADLTIDVGAIGRTAQNVGNAALSVGGDIVSGIGNAGAAAWSAGGNAVSAIADW